MVYAVVLAAGASSRYGDDPPKQTVFLPLVVAALRESSVDGVVVVSGAHPLDVEAVHCPDWERGPGATSSLRPTAASGSIPCCSPAPRGRPCRTRGRGGSPRSSCPATTCAPPGTSTAGDE